MISNDVFRWGVKFAYEKFAYIAESHDFIWKASKRYFHTLFTSAIQVLHQNSGILTIHLVIDEYIGTTNIGTTEKYSTRIVCEIV